MNDTKPFLGDCAPGDATLPPDACYCGAPGRRHPELDYHGAAGEVLLEAPFMCDGCAASAAAAQALCDQHGRETREAFKNLGW